MSIEEFSAYLNTNEPGGIAIVLDASDSGSEFWDEILEFTVLIFERLPVDMEKKLFFLSNPKEYDFHKLAKNRAIWRKENILRGSFLTPVLERLNKNISKIAVIGSGAIYDLDDWRESEFAQKTLFVKIKESLRVNLNIGEEIESSMFDLVRFHDPTQSVEISGEEFMPYYWNNPGYSLSLDDKIALKASNLKDFSTSISFFGKNVKAWIKKAEGEEEIVLVPSKIEPEREEWKLLSKEEREIFLNAIKSKSFVCPICKKNHPYTALRCYDDSSILGRPVYSSLENRRGFVVFKETQNEVLFRMHALNVIKIGDEKVAIATGAKAKIYEYASKESKWIEKEELKLYAPIENNQYIAMV